MNIFYKTWILSFVCSLLVSTGHSQETSPLNFKGDEIAFVGPKTAPLITMMRPESFLGIIFRLDKPEGDRQQLELHQFGARTTEKITVTDCNQVVQKIFGKKRSAGPKLHSRKMISFGADNQFCEIVATNTADKMLYKERRLQAFVLKGKLYALISNFHTPLDEEDANELRNFVKKVR